MVESPVLWSVYPDVEVPMSEFNITSETTVEQVELTGALVFKLAASLRRGPLSCHVVGDRYIFVGGQSEHSIAIAASSRARVLAHWEGYCENNGRRAPRVGDRVAFWQQVDRIGRVVEVGSHRVEIE